MPSHTSTTTCSALPRAKAPGMAARRQMKKTRDRTIRRAVTGRGAGLAGMECNGIELTAEAIGGGRGAGNSKFKPHNVREVQKQKPTGCRFEIQYQRLRVCPLPQLPGLGTGRKGSAKRR